VKYQVLSENMMEEEYSGEGLHQTTPSGLLSPGPFMRFCIWRAEEELSWMLQVSFTRSLKNAKAFLWSFGFSFLILRQNSHLNARVWAACHLLAPSKM
jgi:hypothetical protein